MTYRPKILQISNRVPYPLNEGGTIGIYNYTRGYAEAGCDVTLLALAAKKHNIDSEKARTELEKYCRYVEHEIDTGVKIIPAFSNLFSKESYNVQRFYNKEFESIIIAELNANEFEIIQIEGTFPAVYSQTILKHRKSAKVVLRQHNVEHQIWERLAENSRNKFKSWYMSLLARRLKKFESEHLNQFDAIVPVTINDGELFKSLGCTKPIFPSPSGIDVDYWKPNTKNEKANRIYHMGSLEWMPNVEAVLWFLEEVWHNMLIENPEAEFYIAGKAMPESIRNVKMTGVHVVGEVEDAAEFISDKSICVVPLKSGSGIRLKILEAMAAGKAVVSTTIGAQGIAYTDQENIMISDTPVHFAKCIASIIESEKTSQKLKANGRALIVNEYSNQRVIQNMLDFYESL